MHYFLFQYIVNITIQFLKIVIYKYKYSYRIVLLIIIVLVLAISGVRLEASSVVRIHKDINKT
jgi:hypothetical protein